MPLDATPSPFALHGKTLLIVGVHTPQGGCAAQTCARMGAHVIAQTSFTQPPQPVDGLLWCTPPDHTLATRLQAPADAIKALHAAGLLRQGAAIVLEKNHIPSAPGAVPLCVEGGLSTLAASLALRHAPQAIRVNTLTTHLHPNADEQQDFAHAAIYLLSPASRWVTGSNLVITGLATL
ncbi:MAG: hypothetical protein KAZ24_03485 [Brachymonas sp.]|nr:hypothetical protein [Brachymonas sp.]